MAPAVDWIPSGEEHDPWQCSCCPPHYVICVHLLEWWTRDVDSENVVVHVGHGFPRLPLWWTKSYYQTLLSFSVAANASLRGDGICVVLLRGVKCQLRTGCPSPVGYSLSAAQAGLLVGPLATHLRPLSASHRCRGNIDLPWALITSPSNPQPPSQRERERERADWHVFPISFFSRF